MSPEDLRRYLDGQRQGPVLVRSASEVGRSDLRSRALLLARREYRRLYQAPASALGLTCDQRLVMGDVVYRLGIGFDGWGTKGPLETRVENKAICARWGMSQSGVRGCIKAIVSSGALVEGAKRGYVATDRDRFEGWERAGSVAADARALDVSVRTRRPIVAMGPPWDRCYEWIRMACMSAGVSRLATCVLTDLIAADIRAEARDGHVIDSVWRSSYQIAGRVGADRRHVRHALNSLAATGLIEEVDRDVDPRDIAVGDTLTSVVAAHGGRSSSGGGHSRHWRICWAVIASMAKDKE